MLMYRFVAVLPGMNRLEHDRYVFDLALRNDTEHIAIKIRHTPLPSRLRVKLADHLDQRQALITDQKLHALRGLCFKCLRKFLQLPLSCLAPSQMPKTSLKPSWATLMATSTGTLRTCPSVGSAFGMFVPLSIARPICFCIQHLIDCILHPVPDHLIQIGMDLGLINFDYTIQVFCLLCRFLLRVHFDSSQIWLSLISLKNNLSTRLRGFLLGPITNVRTRSYVIKCIQKKQVLREFVGASNRWFTGRSARVCLIRNSLNHLSCSSSCDVTDSGVADLPADPWLFYVPVARLPERRTTRRFSYSGRYTASTQAKAISNLKFPNHADCRRIAPFLAMDEYSPPIATGF